MPRERPSFRIPISRLLVLILVLGLISAGLSTGSNDLFKLIYTLTFLALVYAAIASRYRGPFWHGFAIAGAAYFLVGFGPWINSSPDSQAPHGEANRSLATSVFLELLPTLMAALEGVPPLSNPMARVMSSLRSQNRAGIGHCVLTLLFALAGGWVSRTLARRSRD